MSTVFLLLYLIYETTIPGNPLLISKSGDNLFLQWDASGGSCQTQDYGIYQGALPWTGYDHLPILCTTAGATSILITPDDAN
jgi:hypothetical protein